MSINKKEFSTEKKLGFPPMESPTLNETFKSKPVEDIDNKINYLRSLGIHEEFLLPLNNMLEEIKASTSEIILHAPEMVAANNRIEKESDLLIKNSRKRVHRSLMDASA